MTLFNHLIASGSWFQSSFANGQTPPNLVVYITSERYRTQIPFKTFWNFFELAELVGVPEEITMSFKLFFAVSAVAMMAGSAAAQPTAPEKAGHTDPARGTKSETMSATKDTMNHAVGVVSAEITSTTKGFVGAAAMTDMYELAAARIAEKRSASTAVKKFASTMIKDHTKTTKELTAIVADNKLVAPIPTVLDTRHQSLIDSLNGAKDSDFDERYAAQQTDIHGEALIVMRGYHNKGDNTELRKFAGTVENAVKMHLSMAERLSKVQDRAEDKAEKVKGN